jgi:hypothetical protein
LGGLIGVTDARYRLKKVATEIDAAQADSVTAS